MKTLKGRTFIIFVSIFLVALCITFVSVFCVVSRDLEKQAIDAAEYEITSAVHNLEGKLGGMQKTYYTAAFSKRLLNELKKPGDEIDYRMILAILEELIYFSDDVYSIYLKDVKHNILLSTETMSASSREESWFEDYMQENASGLQLIHTYDVLGDDKQMFSYIGEMKVDFFGETVAYLSVNILSHQMKQLMIKDKMYEDSIQFIIDASGDIIAQNENFHDDILKSIDEKAKNRQFITCGNRDYLFLEGTTEEEMRYVKLIPEQEIFQSIYKAGILLLCSFILFVVIILCVVNRLLDYLIDPIYELSEKIRNYRKKENEHVEFVTNRTDEFAYLFKSLEDMTAHIDYLIDELYKRDLYKKEMQLKLYRASINPHFIFNILDSIIWTLKFKDYWKVEKTLTSFSDFFRYSLTQNQDNVTVREMKCWLESYCYLASFLKDDQIEVELDIADDLGDECIPSLLLQPAVENSFKYAFGGNGPGKIMVKIEKKEDIIVFVVKDDGIGLSEEKMDEIMNTILTYDIHKTTKHFGLASVYQRLSLLSGGNPDFSLKSSIGEGTEISFSIKV